MKAVNLIPRDLRGGGAAPTRTGAAVYVALGALAAVVVLVAAWAVLGHQVTQRQGDLERVTAEANAAEVQANRLAPYSTFAKLRAKRVETVRSIARSRFNWPFALREVSRVMPSDVWLTSVTGTVAPGVTVEGASGGSGLRGSLQSPAIEITGCTTAHANVARFISRLREVDGVTRVALDSSEKADTGSGGASGASGGGADGDCRQGNAKFPQFSVVAFFERSTAGPLGAGSGAAGAQQATASSTPATPPTGGSK